jgi:WD40 repeat protein/serine/threonine protein kinase
MRLDLASDEALLQRLPLPLAQLYRRAHNAKTALERHLTAFYLWEAGLKLLASVAVIEYAERGTPDPALAERLQGLARPSLGQWWEFVRCLLPVLAEAGDEPFRRVRDLLLGKSRDDLPRAAGLEAALREVQEGKSGARSTVQLGGLFDRLVQYRNAEVGHGATGQRPPEFYQRMGDALLLGVAEVLGRLDVLAGRQLFHVADVRRLISGAWLVEHFELCGETARRRESLEVPESEAARLPRPGRLYLQGAASESRSWRALHPLLVYEAEGSRLFFLNARRKQLRVEYLCYATGEVVKRDELESDQRELLARVLGVPVDGGAIADWAARSQAAEPPVPAEEPVERTIGEFELISRIGQGGMGVVYRAWQPSLGRQVALKCLLRSGDPRAEVRFGREIRALGRVDHPHLVKVFTSGSDGERWFYAMELIEGTDLAAVCARLSASSTAATVGEDDWTAAVSTAWEQQRCREKLLSDDDTPPAQSPPPAPPPARADPVAPRRSSHGHIARVVDVVRQAAEAAHALHEAGVIHRDVKPGNIMLMADGRQAVLMDLGLAQLEDEAEGRLTRTRQFVGTLRYASPEQVLAVGPVDRRADVYSLGATLWEMLTLRPLYGATDQTPTPELMLRIPTTDPERVRRHNPRVPTDLEAIVVRCLERDRNRRYATAAELADDLGRWQRGEPVLAQPPSLRYLLGKLVRRRWKSLGVAAALLLAVGLAVAVSFWQIRTALTNETQARKQAQESLKQAARSFCEVGDRECRQGNLDGLNWLLQAYEMAPEDDVRRPGYSRLLSARGRSLGTTLLHGASVAAVALSPDGRLALTAGKDGMARLWEPTTGKPLGSPLRHGDPTGVVAFSPDSRLALTGGRKGGRLWELATGKQLAEFPHEASVIAVAFSSDNHLLLTGSEDNTARLWDAHGKLLATLGHKGWVQAVAFSPDNRLVLTGSGDGTAQLWETASGKSRATLLHDARVRAVAFGPDDHTALTVDDNGMVTLWNVENGQRQARFGQKDSLKTAVIGAGGRVVLTGSEEGMVRVWSAAGNRLAEFSHEGLTAAALSPDGLLALTTGGNVHTPQLWAGGKEKTARLWETSTGNQLAEFRHDGPVQAVAFGPDGLALTGCADGAARLLEASGGRPRALFLHGDGVCAVAFSPDGRQVWTATVGVVGDPGNVWQWEVASGKRQGGFQYDHGTSVVAFSPDCRLVLTGNEDEDGTVRLWESASGKRLAEFHHGSPVYAVALGPDGRLALTGGKDGVARLWEAAAGKQQGEFHHDGLVVGVAFDPEGRTAFTGGFDRVARLWDLATGKRLAEFHHDTPVGRGAFGMQGRLLITTGPDEVARLWEVATSKCLVEFHHDELFIGALDADGRTALTGGKDATAQMWEVATGKRLAQFRHRGPVYAVAFSPDGRLALTGGQDRTAQLWDVASPVPDDRQRLQAWVRVRTGKAFDDQGVLRPLTPADWLQAWQDLEGRGGDWQPSLDSRGWHLAVADAAEAAKAWFIAVLHLDRLLANDPDNADLRRRRDRARAELEKEKRFTGQ